MSDEKFCHDHYVSHTSDLIADTVCDGCLRLEVLNVKRRGRPAEKYYCRDVQRACFDPRAVDNCESRITTVAVKPPRKFRV